MVVDAVEGSGQHKSYLVSFHERSLDDIRALDDGRKDEGSFAAVARASQMQAEFYDVFVRPWVRAMVTRPAADIGRALHPLRVQRALMSSRNPVAAALAPLAATVAQERVPLPPTNPFLKAERIAADLVEQWIDMARDIRDAAYEMTFFTL